MTARLAVLWQYLIPQRLVCAVIYRAARSTRGWFAGPLIRWFARQYKLDLGEAEPSALDQYASLNALFTRAVKAEARPIATGEDTVVAPADGRITQFGTLTGDKLLQAKGLTYTLPALLGEDPGAPFENGIFATIYLAPHNYHRVHVPLAGRLLSTRFIPGARFSVNEATAQGVPNLFCRNERAVLSFEMADPSQRYFLVMVGALNVSSVSTVTRGELPSGRAGFWQEDSKPDFATGDEAGRFNLGSTVVLVFPRDCLHWLPSLHADQPLKVGEKIAHLQHS